MYKEGKMEWKKIAAYGFGIAVLIAGVADGIRYTKSDAETKVNIVNEIPADIASYDTIVMVYNAYGGIFPGLADVIHKEFFPKSYPCNLCYLAFGTFGMKPEWKHLLDSLPLEKQALHKESFQRMYTPANLPLPAILLKKANSAFVLVSAAEINQVHTLRGLKELLIKSPLNPPKGEFKLP